ncbi:MAG TPA: Gfo/Idh/MocA family oxidoreductase [Oscillatoriales cyanobacterium M59_W2019_021]|nr:Gfo/Idh/MocA family oxidoreductase [Oscillatoriales cyanobacterium M59_W2019_021]
MTNQINIGVIGTGFGRAVHIPGFQLHHRTQVVATYHRDLAKAREIAGEFEIPHACQTVEELVALPEIDAVSIATPPFLHYEMAKTAIAAGKHILLEKPTTLTADEARELYQMATANGVVAAMDFEYRFVPAWQRLAELLAEGYVGTPRLVKIDWLMSSRANSDRPWNWYAQKEKGGGALGALGSHTFDYIAWLFGSVRRLSAKLSTSITERPDPAEGGKLKPVDADDTAFAMLELADRTPVQVSISSVAYGGRGHWVEVYGSNGSLILGSDNQKDYVHGFRLWGTKAGEATTELSVPQRLEFPQTYADGRLAPFLRTIDRWVQGIDGGKMLSPSLREGVYSQLLMDLTHESSATGNWVDVPDLDAFLAL